MISLATTTSPFASPSSRGSTSKLRATLKTSPCAEVMGTDAPQLSRTDDIPSPSERTPLLVHTPNSAEDLENGRAHVSSTPKHTSVRSSPRSLLKSIHVRLATSKYTPRKKVMSSFWDNALAELSPVKLLPRVTKCLPAVLLGSLLNILDGVSCKHQYCTRRTTQLTNFLIL